MVEKVENIIFLIFELFLTELDDEGVVWVINQNRPVFFTQLPKFFTKNWFFVNIVKYRKTLMLCAMMEYADGCYRT